MFWYQKTKKLETYKKQGHKSCVYNQLENNIPISRGSWPLLRKNVN